MIGFFIKKNFCDGWDNVFWLVLNNILCYAILIACYFIGSAVLEISSLPQWVSICISLVLFVISFCVVMTMILCISDACAQIADFKTVPMKEVYKGFKANIKDGILLTFFMAIISSLAILSIYLYLQLGNLLGLFLSAIVAWGFLFFLSAMQWFFPLRSQLKGGFKKTLKKCFILALDNAGFSIFMFIYNLILIALSLFIFLIPGFGGLTLAMNNALRLRMYKYDWLEKHPDLTPKEARKQIPWGELIAEDYDTLGPRSLKSFIFPWK